MMQTTATARETMDMMAATLGAFVAYTYPVRSIGSENLIGGVDDIAVWALGTKVLVGSVNQISDSDTIFGLTPEESRGLAKILLTAADEAEEQVPSETKAEL